MAILKRLRCALFGHEWEPDALERSPWYFPAADCGRCGAHRKRALTPAWMPPMPKRATAANSKVPPSKQESIERELASLRARVAKLEKRCDVE